MALPRRSEVSRKGRIIGRDYTRTRPDGKVETEHYGRGGIGYKGKTVNDRKTGRAESYDASGKRKK